MQKKGRFDYIILETTGLADPAPIASMFWLDDSLGASIYLDGIITVVDAVNITRSLETRDSAEHRLSTAHVQVSHADVLIVNKLDLVAGAEKESVVSRVRSINSLAPLLETTFARLETLDVILDLHAYDSAHLPMDELNRDPSGHLDHVHPSTFLRLVLIGAYFDLIIYVTCIIRCGSGKPRSLDSITSMGGNPTWSPTHTSNLRSPDQRPGRKPVRRRMDSSGRKGNLRIQAPRQSPFSNLENSVYRRGVKGR